ncbi:hypothetical protein V8F20_011832 [Naviculisporaceae sp. PSN 640]
MRRSTVVLAASAGLASATWNVGRDLGMGIPLPARETGPGNAHAAETGWTPRPTEPPGQKAAMDLLKRGRWGPRERQLTNTWVNDVTCGWFSESASYPFTCDTGYTCATNRLNVVGCTSSNSAPFYTVCLDYQAFQQSACVSIGTATGCCTDSAWGACGTFLWEGSPQKSMYRCFAEPTIISMIDRPRAVLDALTSSTTTTSTTSSESTTTTSQTPGPTDGTGGSTDPGDTTSNSSSSTNIGAIVGGAVGGVAVIAIVAGLIAYLIIRKRGKKYSGVAQTDPAATHPGQAATPAPTLGGPTTPQMAMVAGPGGPNGPFPPPAAPAGGLTPGSGATTYPPTSPYAPSVSTVTTAYDPHQSYYDPSKPPLGHVSPGQQFNAYQPPPPGQGQPYPQQPMPQAHVSPPLGYQPQLGVTPELDTSGGHHTGHMSELDSNAMQVGHQYNPAEMGVSTPRPQ